MDGKIVVCLSSDGRTESKFLASTYGVANTGMILHAGDTDLKIAGDNGRIVIKPDTDVVVMALYYFFQMKHVS